MYKRQVCTKALYRILPERYDVKGGGFHVTRRTLSLIHISWVLSDTLKAANVVECIVKAKKHRKVDKPLIFHCDDAEKTKTFRSYTA